MNNLKRSINFLLAFATMIALSSCKQNLIDVKKLVRNNASDAISVSISKAITETVVSCNFDAAANITSSANLSYRVRFSEPINPITFTASDITNTGNGGAVSLIWTILSCGDNKNFKLTTTLVEGDGTIIPSISAGAVLDINNNPTLASAEILNTIRFSTGWNQEAYIKASNSDASDSFGSSVSISGDTLVVAAKDEDSNQVTITSGAIAASTNNDSVNSGAVYVYRRTGENWEQEAYIKASNIDTYESFGSSVSISGDTIAVAAISEAGNGMIITNGATASVDNSSEQSGAVYVYRRTGVNWEQEAYIKSSNNDTFDYFGSSISLDGNTLAVGAKGESSNQSTITNGATAASTNNDYYESGAVYVYKRTGINWEQEAYIKADNVDPYDQFGSAVSVSGDTLVVGIDDEDSYTNNISIIGYGSGSDNSSPESGAVWVYGRTGTNWSQEAYIKARNTDQYDYFGYSVSLSGDTLAVGATGEDSNQVTITNGAGLLSADNSNLSSGAVYIYKRTGIIWEQEAYIKARNNNQYDYFGYSVSLSGNSLAVGAPEEDSNQVAITNGAVALSADNSYLNSGAVYIYKRTGVNWTQDAYIKASNAGAGDNFGLSVSLNGDSLVVGAPAEDSNQVSISNGAISASPNNSNINSGAVYIYRNYLSL